MGATNYFTGGVLASNQNATVSADEAVLNNLTGEIAAEGNIVILDQGHIWRGTNAVYNFKTGEVRATAFKTVQIPYNVSGENLAGDTNHVFTATNAWMTTDDFVKPVYRIRARAITIVPGNYIEARQATLFVAERPFSIFPISGTR